MTAMRYCPACAAPVVLYRDHPACMTCERDPEDCPCAEVIETAISEAMRPSPLVNALREVMRLRAKLQEMEVEMARLREKPDD